MLSAIEHGNRICQWHENLSEDEQPPRWMWHLEDQIDEWFSEVQRKREEKQNDSAAPAESGTWLKNELVDGNGRK